MDKVLRKLAAQLNAYDEASLMAMWEHYADRVENFQPTKEWEESALIFSFIQAVRWKNQLFNHHWAENSRPDTMGVPPQSSFMTLEDVPAPGGAGTNNSETESDGGPADGGSITKRAKVLSFRPRETD